MKRLPNIVKVFAVLCITLIWILNPLVKPARADMGPKPTMLFQFTPVAGQPNLLVTDGVLLECGDSACLTSHPLEDFGPQGFSCFGTTCHAAAYEFAEYHRLVLTFSDGVTRESNIFTKKSFEATYIVTIGKTDLIVEEGRGHLNPNILFIGLMILNILLLAGAFFTLTFLVRKGMQSRGWVIAALIISGALGISGSAISLTLPATLIIELLLAGFYALKRKASQLSTLTLVCLANVITQFAFWIVLNTYAAHNELLLTFGLEIIIWGIEALVFYLPQRDNIKFKEAALLSLVLNLASFGMGLFLPI